MAYMTQGTMPKFGAVADFPDFAARRAARDTSPLLRTVESWLRADRDRKAASGVSTTETAERAESDELRGAAGNGYLPGRFNQGFA